MKTISPNDLAIWLTAKTLEKLGENTAGFIKAGPPTKLVEFTGSNINSYCGYSSNVDADTALIKKALIEALSEARQLYKYE